MENLAITFLIFGLKGKTELTKIILSFYIMCSALWLLGLTIYMTEQLWHLAQLIIDLIVISLCYNLFVDKKQIMTLCYLAWVLFAYLIPETLLFSGSDWASYFWGFTYYACIVDVLFVNLRGWHDKSIFSCYNGGSKRTGIDHSDINGHHSGN